jgi:uncharacterized protein (TIGR02145 family)
MEHKKSFLYLLIFSLTQLTGVLQAQVTVKDIDGNIYLTINVGKQIWIAENLKTTKFNDGKPIKLVTDDKAWEQSKTAAYCWYKNDIKNKDVYGALYNWYTIKTGKLCPKNWHVPTASEWESMLTFLGDPSEAGDKLKEEGTAHWKNLTSNATNEFDFTALPSGMRLRSGIFPVYGDLYAIWWSSTTHSNIDAWNCGLHNDSSILFHGYDNFQNGFSVRCIMD